MREVPIVNPATDNGPWTTNKGDNARPSPTPVRPPGQLRSAGEALPGRARCRTGAGAAGAADPSGAAAGRGGATRVDRGAGDGVPAAVRDERLSLRVDLRRSRAAAEHGRRRSSGAAVPRLRI